MESNFELDLNEFIDPPVSMIGNEHSANQKCERFIAFYFGLGLYCVRAEVVAEVIHALPVAVLPNSPRGISGITAIRGEVIAVLNLKELVNEEGGAGHAKSKMVVLRSPENQTQFAIPADRMHEVVMLPESVIDCANTLVTQVEHEGGFYKIIDTKMLYAEIAAHI
ncbi:MAG: chemotaxis protein CheW [Pyrinomonadaceae bacterium]